jgi:hypothetical protein
VKEVFIMSLFVVLPAAVFAFLPVRPRRYFLLAALAAFLTVNFFFGRSGPENQLLILPVALLGIVAGGLLVEAVIFVRRLVTGKTRSAASG